MSGVALSMHLEGNRAALKGVSVGRSIRRAFHEVLPAMQIERRDRGVSGQSVGIFLFCLEFACVVPWFEVNSSYSAL